MANFRSELANMMAGKDGNKIRLAYFIFDHFIEPRVREGVERIRLNKLIKIAFESFREVRDCEMNTRLLDELKICARAEKPFVTGRVYHLQHTRVN